MYAGVMVGILLILLAGIVYIVVTWPVFCISIAAIGLLCVYYENCARKPVPLGMG